MRTLIAPPPLIPGEIQLDGDEAHHALAVLRVRVGESLRLADGAGLSAEAVVVEAGRTRVRLAVGTVSAADDGPARLLTVAVAAPKGDRLADLVRGLTELGVGAIAPLVCERGERVPASPERLQRVAREALKQCRRAHLPAILPPLALAALPARGGALVLLDPAGGPAQPGPVQPTTLVVGPEGGLSAAETALLAAAGARQVRLARPILRIETAALAAAAVWVAAWG
ncbi:MAG: RsmE family RNA methyltransferase [Planctomycetes bacterium]|nr:RsmE family RNA methyltransferase [Planctomycetota bacterium]